MWKHCSSQPLLLIYAYGQPNSIHSLCLFLLSYSRLFSLWDAAVVSPPDLPVETLGPHAPITTVLLLHLLYPIPYASIYMQYILLPPPTCFSVPTPLTPVIVTL